ncbi:MAG TPA: phosphatase PAP2 family protein [Chitinophagaceae bacterium]|nr:phosphatase PAP2 family protein [Chitinophagaceae bacterium]
MKRWILIIPVLLLTAAISFSQPADSISFKKLETSFRIRSLTLPVSLIAYGFVTLDQPALKRLNVSTKNEIREDHPRFRTHIDNYIQYSPAFAVYGLNALGVKGKNNFRDRTMLFLISEFFMGASVTLLKKVAHQLRPDSSDYYSFPSGHTATAFAGAEFLRQEYKDVSPWIGYAGYGIATITGILRMYNNKHWLSDVITGAGFGILSTRAAYWIYPSVKRKLFREKNVTVY